MSKPHVLVLPTLIAGFLLSVVLVLAMASVASGACPPPAEYTHQASVQDGDVLIYLATEKDTFLHGEPIAFYLAFENTWIDTVRLSSQYSPGYRIVLLPDTCTTMYQTDCDTTWAHLPVFVYFFGETITLLPGECHVVEDTWNEDSSIFPWSPGNYRALGGIPGLYPNDFSVPAGGVELLLTISTQLFVDVERATWGRLKDRYE